DSWRYRHRHLGAVHARFRPEDDDVAGECSLCGGARPHPTAGKRHRRNPHAAPERHLTNLAAREHEFRKRSTEKCGRGRPLKYPALHHASYLNRRRREGKSFTRAMPATNPPTCAQKAIPPVVWLEAAMAVAAPLRNCTRNQ